MNLIQRHEVLFAGRDPTAHFICNANGHAVLGGLIAELRQERVVISAAEYDELLAGFGRQELRLHGCDTLSIDVATIPDREDFERGALAVTG